MARNKGGRPPWKPTPDELKKVEALAARGMTKEQIADCLGIGETTLYEKVKENPEFAKAIKEGKAKGVARVTAALLKNVDLGNVTAQLFWLKCQAKWYEARDEEKKDPMSVMEAIFDELQKKRAQDKK